MTDYDDKGLPALRRRTLPAPVSEESRDESSTRRDVIDTLKEFAIAGDLDAVKTLEELYTRERYRRLIARMDEDEENSGA